MPDGAKRDSGGTVPGSGAAVPARRDTLRDIVRDVVAEARPEELPVVAGLSRVDGAEAARGFSRRARRDQALGFGTTEVVVLVTPIVWTAVHETVAKMTDAATDSILARIRLAIRRVLHRNKPAAPLPHFGSAELAEVRRRVLELAQESGLKPNKANLLADGVVGRLAMIGTTGGSHDAGTQR